MIIEIKIPEIIEKIFSTCKNLGFKETINGEFFCSQYIIEERELSLDINYNISHNTFTFYLEKYGINAQSVCLCMKQDTEINETHINTIIDLIKSFQKLCK